MNSNKIARDFNGLKVDYRPTSSLLPYSRNARVHSPEQIAQIAASIREFGWTNPILIGEDGMVIAGHGRLAAAQQLGMETVPTIELAGLSEEQRRMLVLADNKLALNAGWSEELLALELNDLQSIGADLSVIGFSETEIGEILADHTTGLTDEDAAPEPPAEPVTELGELGDIWLLGKHRLRCGDSTSTADVAALLDGTRPHLMVTDPPYGVEYDATWRGKAGHATMGKNRTGRVTADDRADWRDSWALFPGDVAYVWHGGLHSAVVADSLIATGFSLRAQIIWNKTVMVMGRGDYHWKHEPCWYAVRKNRAGEWAAGRDQTTVWDLASPIHIMSGSKEEKTAHPTQKPAECMRRPMVNNSRAGQLVYDPFLGSGTTVIAAETTGRICLAMEIDPGYCDVSIKRWQEFTGLAATLESGETFASVGARRSKSSPSSLTTRSPAGARTDTRSPRITDGGHTVGTA